MTDRPDHANQDTPDDQYLQFYHLEQSHAETLQEGEEYDHLDSGERSTDCNGISGITS